ncbi:MAG: CpsD/CapB family tyrosine-protein kinase [Alphaproteobacteria bacterium]
MLNLDTKTLEAKQKKLSDFERTLDDNHIIAHRVQSKEADIVRFLRTQILQKMEKNKFKTLAISSPRYGDGKTTMAANLAVSISQDLKQTVLLVDTDLRDPSLAKYMGIDTKNGLTNYLSGDATVADCLVRLPFQRISLFPAGNPVDFSSETLGSPEMKKLADELKERYDDRLIIYDMPPLLDQDDPLVFLPHVDAFLLVIKEGMTTTEEVKRSIEILDPSKVIGVVLNAS